MKTQSRHELRPEGVYSTVGVGARHPARLRLSSHFTMACPGPAVFDRDGEHSGSEWVNNAAGKISAPQLQ